METKHSLEGDVSAPFRCHAKEVAEWWPKRYRAIARLLGIFFSIAQYPFWETSN
ncbi:hypothetical protein PORCRE_1234 [Porphyromonas crevioricanis JCM 15906]|uniref:Uncharacterized protein n=1 Tax=Porphyromonas crevioricanis JCM 15906 TaxID=1305617 RepID=T1DT05_9PORP|nr:hypothetical protein PORCRE_1234 [Porphyromonas crevioricanis JCM 15906]